MFSLPGVIGLILLIYVRPQEHYKFLQAIPLLYIFMGASIFGMVIDIKLRLIKPRGNPQLPMVILFVIWCVINTLIKASHNIGGLIQLVIIVVVYITPTFGIQSFKTFHVLAKVMLGLCLWLCVIGIYMGHSPLECLAVTEFTNIGIPGAGKPDGRPCKKKKDCLINPEPGAEYLCEHTGVMGTYTVTRRVRYRGKLGDSNEMSMALGAVMTFSFAFFLHYRTRFWLFISIITLPLVFYTTLLSQSRGGLLVFVLVLGIWMVKRMGKKAIVAGAFMLLPLVALMKMRERADAKESSEERIEIIGSGVRMFRSAPLMGVGWDQFTTYHHITAHNSYLLALSEIGLVGAWLWIGILYVTTKILIIGILRYSPKGLLGGPRWARAPPYKEGGELAVIWGWTLLASMAGMYFGIFLLSFCYHIVLWINLGLVGAYANAVKTHDPDFEVKFTYMDAMYLTGLVFFFIFVVHFMGRGHY